MLPAAAARVLYLKQPDFRVRIEAQPAGSPLKPFFPTAIFMTIEQLESLCLLDCPPGCPFLFQSLSSGTFVYLEQGWEVVSDQEDGFLAGKFVEHTEPRIRVFS